MNWMSRDRAAVREVMSGLEAAGYLVSHDDRRFEPPEQVPEGPPAYFVAWRLARGETRPGFFGAGTAPERTGGVIVEFWVQPGRGTVALDEDGGLYDVVMAHFQAAATHLAFFHPEQLEDGTGEAGGTNWYVQSLVFPYKAA